MAGCSFTETRGSAVEIKGSAPEGVTTLLRELDARQFIPKKLSMLILKPNLVQAKPYPVTTSPEIIDRVIAFFSNRAKRIVIAEGSGIDTNECFDVLGYRRFEEQGIELIDLNHARTVVLTDPNAIVLKKFHIPKMVLDKDAYLISIANLKHHHIAKVTLTLKNMFGIAPGDYYKYNVMGKPWLKERLHDLGVEQSIVDINMYRYPDLGIIDGRIAQLHSELGGPKKEMNVFLGGDPVAVDRRGAELLGISRVWYIEEISRRRTLKRRVED